MIEDADIDQRQCLLEPSSDEFVGLTRFRRTRWLEQTRRDEALLNEPALPTQTLKIARARLQEALAMVRTIDAAPDGTHISR